MFFWKLKLGISSFAAAPLLHCNLFVVILSVVERQKTKSISVSIGFIWLWKATISICNVQILAKAERQLVASGFTN